MEQHAAFVEGPSSAQSSRLIGKSSSDDTTRKPQKRSEPSAPHHAACSDSTRLDECPEEPFADALAHLLRMPLYAEFPCARPVVACFDRLDDAVRSVRDCAMVRPDPRDRLMVLAVHRRGPAPEKVKQDGCPVERDRMTGSSGRACSSGPGRCVARSAWSAPAAAPGHQLHAVTDAEHREAASAGRVVEELDRRRAGPRATRSSFTSSGNASSAGKSSPPGISRPSIDSPAPRDRTGSEAGRRGRRRRRSRRRSADRCSGSGARCASGRGRRA